MTSLPSEVLRLQRLIDDADQPSEVVAALVEVEASELPAQHKGLFTDYCQYKMKVLSNWTTEQNASFRLHAKKLLTRETYATLRKASAMKIGDGKAYIKRVIDGAV